MKLDFDKFPTIKNLADDVREKALEYAASLGARGPRPTTVLGTAVTLAKEWKSGRLPAKPLAAPFLVQPRQGRWIIKRSTEAEPSHVFQKKDDAVRRAQQLAKAAGAACFVFGPGGTLIERYEAKALATLVLAPPLDAEPVAEPLELAPEVAPEMWAEQLAMPLAPVIEVSFEAPVVGAPVVEAPVVEAPVVEAPVVEAPVVEAPVVEVAAEAAVEADELDDLPTANPSGEDAIRVKKLGNKWALIVGDGRTETHATRAKAVSRAKALAKKLGRPVVVA